MKKFLEKTFSLSLHNTTIRKELVAGAITFLTMSYILSVNPKILSDAGMDSPAVFTATALASIIATLLMAFLANLPIAQAPGMGLNNFFAYSVVIAMGCTWQFALAAVFISGIIFLFLTFFNVREIIVKNIPKVLKDAIPVGIGLFIAMLGFKGAGIIQADPNTFVKLGDFANHSVWIALLGLLITAILFIRNVNGAFLFGIIAATIFALFLGDISMPEKGIVALPPSLKPTFAQFDFSEVLSFKMVVVVFTFLIVNLFDTMGTLIGVISKTNIADKDGNIPQMRKALFSDAVGTTIGSVLGTSNITSYIESASGVASGGRTGLTALSTAMLFVVALFLSPLFLMVPAAATAPALIVVGLFMISSVVKINFDNMLDGLPAFLTIVLMPFTSSIAEGIIFGVLSFTLLRIFTAKFKEVPVALYILSILFLFKIILDASKFMETNVALL